MDLNSEVAGKPTAVFKQLGYKYVTLDLEDYRHGSLNEVLRDRHAEPVVAPL